MIITHISYDYYDDNDLIDVKLLAVLLIIFIAQSMETKTDVLQCDQSKVIIRNMGMCSRI